MPWHPDDLDIPIEKPEEIAELEKMGQEMLDSMPLRERDDKVEKAAIAVAKKFKKEVTDANYNDCLAVVSVALNTTGSALGGDFGAYMVGRSETEAQHACKLFFNTD